MNRLVKSEERKREEGSDGRLFGVDGGGERGSTKIIELKLYTNCFMNMILSHTKEEREKERIEESKITDKWIKASTF